MLELSGCIVLHFVQDDNVSTLYCQPFTRLTRPVIGLKYTEMHGIRKPC